jgi:phosphatidate cytidylyltransferase
MLLQRTLSAAVLAPVVLWAAYQGGVWFFLIVVVAAVLAVGEFYRLMAQHGHSPSVVVGVALTVALLLDAAVPSLAIGRFSVVAAVGLLMVVHVLQGNRTGFVESWGLTIVGALYIGGMGSHLILVRNMPMGLQWLFLTLLVVWTSDSAAYAFGSRFGRHKLAPEISPNKSWEGAIAGALLSFAVAIVVSVTYIHVHLWQGALLGVLLNLAAVFGDLSKSLIKRQVGVKDTGNLIPGHGGMLDRIDSLLFGGVVTYYFALWIVGL